MYKYSLQTIRDTYRESDKDKDTAEYCRSPVG